MKAISFLLGVTWLTATAIVVKYQVSLLILGASLATYLYLRFRVKKREAFEIAFLTFLGLFAVWIVVIWVFYFPQMKL